MGKSDDNRQLRNTLLVFIFSACTVSSSIAAQDSSAYSFFHPPLLSTSGPSVDIPTGTTFTIECEGRHPLTWKLPEQCENNIWERANVTNSFDHSLKDKYKSKLTVDPTTFLDTGYFSCVYNGTTDFESHANVTSLYVFVNDPQNLFRLTLECQKGGVVAMRQFNLAVIGCPVTGSTVNVTLWKNGPGEPVMVSPGEDMEYDPMVGFKIYYPSFFYHGPFHCKAELDNHTQEISWMLFFLPDTPHEPEPRIEDVNANHPVVNSTFNLTCTVNVDLETIIYLNWDYPNKGDPRIKEMNPTVEQAVGRNSYKFQKISRQLVVTDAQFSDEGVYRCTATDHMSRTAFVSVQIAIYGTEHPAFLNFTTDIDVSRPVIFNSGQDVRLIFTIHAFPNLDNVETYWLKDGSLLPYADPMRSNLESRRILTIRNLNRTNAGVYTLCGKNKDVENNISFTLYVRGKPTIVIDQKHEYYMLGQRYTFHCNGYGYPQAEVWWRWMACSSPMKCQPEININWQDVGDKPGPFNNDTMTVAEGGTFEKIAKLQVIANQSGQYRCMASNDMGEVKKTILFIVTDATDGFEVTFPRDAIIERDNITMTCKASVFNYSRIEWNWKPMSGNGTEVQVNDSDNVTVVSSSSVYSHSSTLVFHSIQVSRSGEYLCIAWNDDTGTGSTQSGTVYVQTIEKPVLDRSNLENNLINAKLDGQMDLMCFGSGVPMPTVTWFKDKKSLVASNSSRVEFSENNQRLVIKRVQEKDSGLYHCRVENRGGFVIRNTTLHVYSGEVLTADGTDVTMISVFVVIGFVLLILVFLLGRRMYLDRKQRAELEFLSHKCFTKGQLEIFNPSLPLEDQIDLLPYDQCWEFPKERLKLGRTLGQGAFGRVLKAEAIGLRDGDASTIVAVKLLKERADINQRKALMAELKFLIHLGRHLNIVNLLGAATKNLNKGELMVIVEYCCYGNLRHYLLRHRETYFNQIDPNSGKVNPNLCKLPGFSVSKDTEEKVLSYQNVLGLGVVNPMYGEKALNYAELLHSNQCSQNSDSSAPVSIDCDRSGRGMNSYCSSNSEIISKCKDEKSQVTTCDLLCYAFQCSRGMEYLESRKLIHRDLAARNVLLAKDNVVKICDFGLAKDCYKYSNYVKKGDGPLPIKWMAIESIRDRVFTIKSDIWSFGILLWEFFTLGGNPYPGIDIDEGFYRRLKNGYRMEKPDFAPDNMYQIMMECWQAEPNQRPDFATLTDKLGSLLEASVRKYYIELNNPYMDMNEKLFNNNDYLQMAGKNSNYTSMEDVSNSDVIATEFSSEPETNTNSSGIYYDNISSVRPVGNGPMPKVPMEVVPMIQLESTNEKWDNFQKLNSNSSNKTSNPFSIEYSNEPDYMLMASSVDIEDDDSVFLETSSGFHSDYTNSDEKLGKQSV